MNFEKIFVFRKYNRSNNGQVSDNNLDSDKTVSKYIYGDDISNIDNKISAKNGEIYISTRKSDQSPTIYIYIDQNQNRNYNKAETFAKIENLKNYLSQTAKINIVEFGSLDENDVYISNLPSIMDHIRNREVDLPVVIISDRLGLDEKIAEYLYKIHSLTDLFCFQIPLPNISQNYNSFYLLESLALPVKIYDL